jgi:hypothetical protein
MSAISNDAIPLRDAPARFLADDWAKLVDLSGSEAKALEAFTCPEPGMIGYYRLEMLRTLDLSAGERAIREREAAAVELAEALRVRIKDMLTSGHLIGTGFFSGTGQRQNAPPEIWPDLELNFERGEAEGKIGLYTHVVVSEPASAPDADELRARMVEWLARRRDEYGAEKKQALIDFARGTFSGAFRVQAFNAAFREVYGYKRGRPEASRKNEKTEF